MREFDVLTNLGHEWVGSESAAIACPSCTAEGVEQPAHYVHFDESIFHATDDYTSPTGERGSWVDVPCWCEHGDHHFHIVVAYHKGQSFLHLVEGAADGEWGTTPLEERERSTWKKSA